MMLVDFHEHKSQSTCVSVSGEDHIGGHHGELAIKDFGGACGEFHLMI